MDLHLDLVDVASDDAAARAERVDAALHDVALANEPAVLLADEPTGNLDRANGERVAEVFQELSVGGQTIVMVTHDLALAGRARRLVRMEDGQVVEDKPLASNESRGMAIPRR